MERAPKILIIDDEPAVSALLRDTLRMYETVCAYNGVQAMKYFNIEPADSIKKIAGALEWDKIEAEWTDPSPGRPVDLVLCDWLMPRIDGYTLLTHMMNEERARGVPVIVVTSKDKMAEAFLDFPNVVGFISKPFDPEAVLAKVREALASKGAA